jgi:hypothetical protein
MSNPKAPSNVSQALREEDRGNEGREDNDGSRAKGSFGGITLRIDMDSCRRAWYGPLRGGGYQR